MSKFKKPTGKRDENEPDMIKVIEAYGYVSLESILSSGNPSMLWSFGWYRKCSQWEGRDIELQDEHGQVQLEIKMPGEKLEARERIYMHLCYAFGIPWYKVETVDGLSDILNSRKNAPGLS